ncbi:MAG: hypothetical protein R2715_25235 [Ilumatobacteraceae bacterium]
MARIPAAPLEQTLEKVVQLATALANRHGEAVVLEVEDPEGAFTATVEGSGAVTIRRHDSRGTARHVASPLVDARPAGDRLAAAAEPSDDPADCELDQMLPMADRYVAVLRFSSGLVTHLTDRAWLVRASSTAAGQPPWSTTRTEPHPAAGDEVHGTPHLDGPELRLTVSEDRYPIPVRRQRRTLVAHPGETVVLVDDDALLLGGDNAMTVAVHDTRTESESDDATEEQPEGPAPAIRGLWGRMIGRIRANHDDGTPAPPEPPITVAPAVSPDGRVDTATRGA